ncbi:effector-associated domain 2-containing protein [Streptomyces sp. cg35]|uniref:effector-associated domain 2-containing protein n=1 Tax=Streptomyces sp. cg35 TaxID=3421650 RepID=UPI003D17F375
MPDRIASTHAVIVGVERYDGGPGWDLDGPVRDAVGHARRLLAAGLPPERITLLLSPAPHNEHLAAEAGLGFRRAGREAVHQALFRELPSRSGDFFFLAWSGHGLVAADGHRRLLYADATERDIRSLDLDAALAAWRSDLVPSFPHQLWLLDACQLFADPARLDGALAPDPVPVRPLRERPGQHALFACAPGQSARGSRTGGPGVFTAAVHDLWDEGGGAGSWPADPRALADQVRERVAAQGTAAQTPTYFWHCGPQGQSEQWRRPAPAPAGPARPARARRRELVLALERVPAMREPDARARVIRQLPPEIAASVPQSAITRPALLDLVDTCLEFPDGLDELCDALEMVDPGTLAYTEFSARARELTEKDD